MNIPKSTVCRKTDIPQIFPLSIVTLCCYLILSVMREWTFLSGEQTFLIFQHGQRNRLLVLKVSVKEN